MTVFKHASLVWAGTLAAAALAFATQIILARHFQASTFGILSNAYVISVLVATFGFQGIADVLLRHQGRVPLGQLLLGSAVLTAIALAGALIWAALEGGRDQDPGMLLAFIPFVVVQGLLFAGMTNFQLAGDYRAIALWPVILHLGRVLIAIGVLLFSASALSVPIGWTVILLPAGIYGVMKLRNTIADATARDAPTTSTAVIAPALPFSVSRMLEFAEIQLPIVLAMALFGPSEAGLAAAALVFIQGLLLLPISIFQRLLRARMHEWANEEPRKLMRHTLRGALLMALMGAIFGIAIWPFANTLLKFVYGNQYVAAADFLRIMLAALPIWFAAIAVNSALVSQRLAVDRLALQLVGIGAIVLTAFSANTEVGLAWLAWAILIGQSILLVGAVCLLVLRTRLQAA